MVLGFIFPTWGSSAYGFGNKCTYAHVCFLRFICYNKIQQWPTSSMAPNNHLHNLGPFRNHNRGGEQRRIYTFLHPISYKQGEGSNNLQLGKQCLTIWEFWFGGSRATVVFSFEQHIKSFSPPLPCNSIFFSHWDFWLNGFHIRSRWPSSRRSCHA